MEIETGKVSQESQQQQQKHLNLTVIRSIGPIRISSFFYLFFK